MSTDLNLLHVFLAVAQTSSFSAAARKLTLPKSSVSRGIASLEDSLGTQLFNRSTRHVSLTPAGVALQERATPLLASLQEALGTLPEREHEPAGLLRITAPHDLGTAFIAEWVARFTARHPLVKVEAHLSNQAVDLVAEGIDLAIRATSGQMKDSSLVMRRLSTIEMQLYASPAYLARRGIPRSSEELAAHECVTFRGSRVARELGVPHSASRILADDFSFIREAVRAGAGLGVLPSFLGQGDLASGQLVRVLPKVSLARGSLVLLYPRSQHPAPKLTAFLDFLVESMAARPSLKL